MNPVSIGHFTSLGSPQNGHVTPCGTSFARLNGPETVNVFLHFVQVIIFSIRTLLRDYRRIALRDTPLRFALALDFFSFALLGVGSALN